MFTRCFFCVFIIATMLIADKDKVQIELRFTYNSPAEYGTPQCKVSLQHRTTEKTFHIKDGDMVAVGEYIIALEAKGYKTYHKELSITKNNSKFVFAHQFVAMRRNISTKITSTSTDKVIAADKITFDDKTFTEDLQLSPGQYKVVITKEGYVTSEKQITILADDKDFVLEQKLQPLDSAVEKAKPKDLSRAHVVLKLVSDFNLKPIKPDAATLDGKAFIDNKDGAEIHTKNITPTLNVKKQGYYSIIEYLRVHRGEKNVIVRNLVSKPRKFQVKITSNDGKSIIPQQMKLGKQDIRYAQHIKPGKYEFYASHQGYQPIKKTIEVMPQEKPYIINEVMQTIESTKNK